MRVYSIGDLHDSPKLKQDRFTWLNEDIAAFKPDHIVLIGDVGSFDSLSTHDANDTIEGQKKPTFKQDMDSLNEALARLRHNNQDIPCTVTLGNHENRVWKFSNNNPELSMVMQETLISTFNRFNITAKAYGAIHMVGGVGFTHVPFSIMGKPLGGEYPEQRIAAKATHDLVFGHTHRANLVTSAKVGAKTNVRILNLGCALPQGYIEPYANHCLTGWTYGTWILEISKNQIQNMGFNTMATIKNASTKHNYREDLYIVRT